MVPREDRRRAQELVARGVELSGDGQLDEGMECFCEAVRLDGDNAAAHFNLGNAMLAASRGAGALDAYRDAITADPDFAIAHANLGLALLDTDDLHGALHALERAVELDPSNLSALSGLSAALLRKGDSRRALDTLRRNLARDPTRTLDLALTAVALQRPGAPDGAGRLLDLHRLVVDDQPPPPPGYADLDTFNGVLAAHVLAQPSLADSPRQHATRGGQHSGDLLVDDAPVIRALENLIEGAVERYVAGGAGAHPYVADAPGTVAVAAWAVVLDSGGYQVPHIHPSGWLSGVYYVRIPDPDPACPGEGGIEFGRPDPALGDHGDSPTRLLTPVPGTLVLFPSYVYHRTIPFSAPGPRISIAFDIMRASASPAC